MKYCSAFLFTLCKESVLRKLMLLQYVRLKCNENVGII